VLSADNSKGSLSEGRLQVFKEPCLTYPAPATDKYESSPTLLVEGLEALPTMIARQISHRFSVKHLEICRNKS